MIVFSQLFFSGCGFIDKRKDEAFNYTSIVGKQGTVKTNLGGQLIEYVNYTVEYSDSDASTLLLKSPEGRFVYIQGFAVIEFDDNFSDEK
ncbi:MAG: hypothetical protein KDC85_09570 [Saprospiraceae bacterium]|nr:hypothetical protein [Saprospiraceae bacterium]MCB9322956.1 hypothetical protein [Lewinellaceae bacterium]